MRTTLCVLVLAIVAGIWGGRAIRAAEPLPEGGVFAKPNLVAWCIVPFDTAHRGPQQRAEMLQKLGIRKFAYDWRPQHVPSFEEEIVQIKKHGIEYFAFWDFHPEIVPLLGKHHVTPQFWVVVPSPPGTNENEKVEAAAKQLRPLVEKTRALGCKIGLYNHGGWGGEPASMVAVAKRLRQDGANGHVGIVYNFHHGHGHIADFAEVLTAMQPYLLCINLNGMNDNARPLILPIGFRPARAEDDGGHPAPRLCGPHRHLGPPRGHGRRGRA